MNIKTKDTLIKQCKKYNYKIFEHERYDSMSGCEYSYFVTDYNETEMIFGFTINYSEVENYIRKLEN